MKPSLTLATVTTSAGTPLSLRVHDGHYHLRVGGRELMSTAATGSEIRLAEVACEHLSRAGRARVLIGGLGFGFTLRRALELVHAEVTVEVAELLPEVVAWNRSYLQAVNGGLVDDARVTILIEDVHAVLARAPVGHYAAVMLDVDNGPDALVERNNARLYAARGLELLSRALRPGGRAVFWSATGDAAFLKRLEHAGFRATAMRAKPHARAKRGQHTLFVADKGS